MTIEISLHQQLAAAHQQIAQLKTEILRLHEEERKKLESFNTIIQSVKQELSDLRMSVEKTALPLNMPHMKTLRDEGFDYIETLPDDLTTIKGIGHDKAANITNFLQNGKEAESNATS